MGWISDIKHAEALVSVTNIRILLNLFWCHKFSGWPLACEAFLGKVEDFCGRQERSRMGWRTEFRQSDPRVAADLQQIKFSDGTFTLQICSVVSFQTRTTALDVRRGFYCSRLWRTTRGSITDSQYDVLKDEVGKAFTLFIILLSKRSENPWMEFGRKEGQKLSSSQSESQMLLEFPMVNWWNVTVARLMSGL